LFYKAIAKPKTKERLRAKKYELKAKEVKAILLVEERRIMMTDLSSLDPKRRVWFEKKHAMIRTHDA
jgi:hypothetical protein